MHMMYMIQMNVYQTIVDDVDDAYDGDDVYDVE